MKKQKPLKISYESSEEDVYQLLQTHINEPALLIETANGKLLSLNMMCAHLNTIIITDVQTNMKPSEMTSMEDTIGILRLRIPDNPEITNETISICLDEYNFLYYKQTHPAKKEIAELEHLARQIMDRTLLPDIFNQIPLNKNHTFHKDRTIPIFRNGITAADPYYRVKNREHMLGIVTYGSWTYDKHFNDSIITTPKRARLCITSVKHKKELSLLNADLTINCIC